MTPLSAWMLGRKTEPTPLFVDLIKLDKEFNWFGSLWSRLWIVLAARQLEFWFGALLGCLDRPSLQIESWSLWLRYQLGCLGGRRILLRGLWIWSSWINLWSRLWIVFAIRKPEFWLGALLGCLDRPSLQIERWILWLRYQLGCLGTPLQILLFWMDQASTGVFVARSSICCMRLVWRNSGTSPSTRAIPSGTGLRSWHRDQSAVKGSTNM